MCKKDHIFIRFIEFGIKKSEEGFSSEAFRNWTKSEKLSDNERSVCAKYFNDFFTSKSTNNVYKNFLKPETYFNYLDYIELKEARKSSTQAFWLSFIAIGISLVSILISIYGTVKLEKETTINLSKSTIESIVNGMNK